MIEKPHKPSWRDNPGKNFLATPEYWEGVAKISIEFKEYENAIVCYKNIITICGKGLRVDRARIKIRELTCRITGAKPC